MESEKRRPLLQGRSYTSHAICNNILRGLHKMIRQITFPVGKQWDTSRAW